MVKKYVVSIHFTGMYETTVRATDPGDAQHIAEKRLHSVLDPGDIEPSGIAFVTEEATQYD